MKKMEKLRDLLLSLVSILLFTLFFQNNSFAVTSFSRLCKMSCTACHSTTPRLNYFGEKFMLKGYELDRMSAADRPASHPETEATESCTSCHSSGQKGEVGAAKISPNLYLHDISNILSFRVKFTALDVTAHDLTVKGEKETRITVGKGNWIQFWVAGPIAKNIAVRAEAELSDGKAVDLHNYAFAFSNLLKRDGLLNLRVGGFTHGEWLSFCDQKRAFDPHFNIYGVKSAKGAGADTYKVSGAEPAIELYGYKGPVVYEVGLSNGKSTSDVNKYKNYWGTVKLYIPTGPIAGSSISGQYSRGTDSNSDVTQIDHFSRYILSANLRWGLLDVASTYASGKDDNWDLSTNLENQFNGWFVQVLFTASKKLTPGLIYQRTKSDDKTLEYNHLLLGCNYYIRENQFISTYYDADLLSTSTYHPYKKGKFIIQYRAMF